MSKSKELKITELSLDLKNYRTLPQATEEEAIKAMLFIKPEKFLAVMESIIDDGYIKTENIIVLEDNGVKTVKEGNRRVGVLKILHGIHNHTNFIIQPHIRKKIEDINEAWKKENSTVPCLIYGATEIDKADKIVRLTHAKGEKASRDPWTSVATARYNRDEKKVSEPALDLLEKYIAVGKNLTGQQKERWSGDYSLTTMNEAVRSIYPRLGFSNFSELVAKYPTIPYLDELEELLRDVGLEQLVTKTIRNTENGYDFALTYGFPPLPPKAKPSPSTGPSPAIATGIGTGVTTTTTPASTPGTATTVAPPTTSGIPGTTAPSGGGTVTSPKPPKAAASNDPNHVISTLKKFAPRGVGRQKVVLLKDELIKLNINKNPIAFCFLLRSIFEISAKIYADEKGIATTTINGTKVNDKQLKVLLTDIIAHLIGSPVNSGLVKVLHGASTEISNPTRILSVTSLNQLVHSPTFSVTPKDVCTFFGNVYPLLELMN